MILRLALLVVLCCGASACAGKRPRPQQPVPQLVGHVAFVNEAMRFTLLDVGTYYSPQPGQALKAFRSGEETAVLAVTAERKRPFIAADIVSGEPQQGDAVYE